LSLQIFETEKKIKTTQKPNKNQSETKANRDLLQTSSFLKIQNVVFVFFPFFELRWCRCVFVSNFEKEKKPFRKEKHY